MGAEADEELRPQPTRSTLTVPTVEEPATTAPSGGSREGGPPPSKLAHRRCSARLLSLNVREAIRLLRQKEHKARVSALVQRNADFYRRQRCCECVTMMTMLTLFTSFSLYIIFAYGFYVGQREPFHLLAKERFPKKIRHAEVKDMK